MSFTTLLGESKKHSYVVFAVFWLYKVFRIYKTHFISNFWLGWVIHLQNTTASVSDIVSNRQLKV